MRKLVAILILLSSMLLIGGQEIEVEQEQELTIAPIYPSPMIAGVERMQSRPPAEMVEEVVETVEEPAEEYQKESAQGEGKSEFTQSGGTITATITHYCACSVCNGSFSYQQDGINHTHTASGIDLYDGMPGNYCAATFGKLGDVIEINGVEYTIVDRMGSSAGKRVDIFVAAGHSECNRRGKYAAEIKF